MTPESNFNTTSCRNMHYSIPLAPAWEIFLLLVVIAAKYELLAPIFLCCFIDY